MSYAAKITKDHLAEDSPLGEEYDVTGQFAVEDIEDDEELEELVRNSNHTERFKLYDDDNILYYTGVLYASDYESLDEGAEELFSWAQRYAGCTSVRFPYTPNLDMS